MQAFLKLLHKDFDTPTRHDSADNSPRSQNKSSLGTDTDSQKQSNFTTEAKSAFQRKPVFNQEDLRIIRNKLEASEPGVSKIEKILKSEKRTDYEARTLYEQIQDFAFFQTFNERNQGQIFESEAFMRLCKNLKYEKHLPGRVIFKEGDAANGKLYIIYSGEVSVISKHENVFHKMNREAMEKEEEAKSQAGGITNSKPQTPKASIYFPTQYQELEDGFDEIQETEPMPRPSRIPKSRSTTIHIEPLNFGKISNDNKKSDSSSPAYSRKITKQFGLKRINTDESRLSGDSSKSDSTSRRGSLHKKIEIPITVTRNEKKKMTLSNAMQMYTPITIQQPPPQTTSLNFLSPTNALSPSRNLSSVNSLQIPGFSQAIAQLQLPGQSQAPGQLQVPGMLQPPVIRHSRRNTIRMDMSMVNQEKNQDRLSLADKTIHHERGDSLTIENLASKYGIVKDTIGKGGFFGERALFDKAPRNATIMVNCPTELLVVNKADFIFVSENYDKKKKRLLEFMVKVFPELDYVTSHSLEELIYRLEEKRYSINDYICKEGEKSDKFYVLGAGQCQLFKTVILDDTKKRAKGPKEKFQQHMRNNDRQKVKIPICWIEPGVFIGEEILINGTGLYHYNVKVISTDAIVYAIDKPKFNFNFPKQVGEQVKTSCTFRAKQNFELIKELIDFKYPEYMLEDSTQTEFNSAPLVLIPHNINLELLSPKNKSPIKAKPKFEKMLEPIDEQSKINSAHTQAFEIRVEPMKEKSPAPITPKTNLDSISEEKKLQILNLSRKAYIPYSNDLRGTLANPSRASNESNFNSPTHREYGNSSVMSVFRSPGNEKAFSPDKAAKKVAEVIRSKNENEGALTWDEYYNMIDNRLSEIKAEGPEDYLNLELIAKEENEKLRRAKRIKAGLYLPQIVKFPLTESEKKKIPRLETLRKKVNKILNHSSKHEDSAIINTSRMNLLNSLNSPLVRGSSVLDDSNSTNTLNLHLLERFNPLSDRINNETPFKPIFSKKKSQITVQDSLQYDRESTNFKMGSVATDISMRTKPESEKDDRSVGQGSNKQGEISKRNETPVSKGAIHNSNTPVNPSGLLKRKAEINKRLKFKSLKPIKSEIKLNLDKLSDMRLSSDVDVSPISVLNSSPTKRYYPNMALATDPY